MVSVEYAVEGFMVLLLMFGGAAWFAVHRVRFGREAVHSAHQSRREAAATRGRLSRKMGYCPTCHAVDDEECIYFKRGDTVPTGLGSHSVHLKRTGSL